MPIKWICWSYRYTAFKQLRAPWQRQTLFQRCVVNRAVMANEGEPGCSKGKVMSSAVQCRELLWPQRLMESTQLNCSSVIMKTYNKQKGRMFFFKPSLSFYYDPQPTHPHPPHPSKTSTKLMTDSKCYYYYYWSLLYSAVLPSLADSLCSHVILHEWIASSFFIAHF